MVKGKPEYLKLNTYKNIVNLPRPKSGASFAILQNRDVQSRSGQPIHHQTEVWWFNGRLNSAIFSYQLKEMRYTHMFTEACGILKG